VGNKNNHAEMNDKLAIELDSLDLLKGSDEKGGPDDLSEESLEKTLSVFSARIHKRFEEHREAESQADRESRERQVLLLSALMRSRKLMRGVINLDLGPDIELTLISDDLQGWPRMVLVPRLRPNPDVKLSFFEVSGTDRAGFAQLDFFISSGVLREQFLLFRQDDLGKVAKLLKRAIRQFFDSLAEEIIKPAVNPDIPEPVAGPSPEPQPESDSFHAADLFEESTTADVLERLSETEEIKSLPEL